MEKMWTYLIRLLWVLNEIKYLKHDLCHIEKQMIANNNVSFCRVNTKKTLCSDVIIDILQMKGR